MKRKYFLFFAATLTFVFSQICLSQNYTAQNYSEWSSKIYNELNPKLEVQKAHQSFVAAEAAYRKAVSSVSSYSGADGHPVWSNVPEDVKLEYQKASKNLTEQQAQLKTVTTKLGEVSVTSEPIVFADRIVNDLKGSSKTVGFLAGNSASGHDAGVVDHLNKMQRAAAVHFNMDAKSGYALVNGASMDGGINQRFEEAVKDGRFIPAGDKSNFKSYGAVSVNIGEYGGMMQSNKSVLIYDTPTQEWELKSHQKSPSQNPRVLADVAQLADANVHIMLTEGGEIGMKEVLEYITNHHDPKTKALIHLGIGYNPTNVAKDKGFRGASFLAKFFSQHPEMIDEMEKKGINLMAVDAQSDRHYSSFKEYLKSNDWKTQLIKFRNASIDKDGKDYKDKKAKIAVLEDSLKTETDKDKKKQFNNSISTLKGEITLVDNRVISEQIVSKYLAENSKTVISGHDKTLLEKMSKAAATSDVAAIRRSGAEVDAKEAARAAARGVK